MVPFTVPEGKKQGLSLQPYDFKQLLQIHSMISSLAIIHMDMEFLEYQTLMPYSYHWSAKMTSLSTTIHGSICPQQMKRERGPLLTLNLQPASLKGQHMPSTGHWSLK
jgi:hypothetical protein